MMWLFHLEGEGKGGVEVEVQGVEVGEGEGEGGTQHNTREQGRQFYIPVTWRVVYIHVYPHVCIYV